MSARTISFKFPDERAFAELERRRQKAGDESVNLYVKRILVEHLAADDRPDPLNVVLDQVDEVRQAVLQNAELHSRTSQQLDDVLQATRSTGRPSEELAKEFRTIMGRVAMILLTAPRPLDPADALQFIERNLGRECLPPPGELQGGTEC